MNELSSVWVDERQGVYLVREGWQSRKREQQERRILGKGSVVVY